MRMILADIRGGLSIIHQVPVPTAIIGAAVVAAEYVLDPQHKAYLQGTIVEKLVLENKELAFIVSLVVIVAVCLLPILYMMEAALTGAERLAGMKSRFRLLLKFRVILVFVFSILLTALVFVILGISLSFLYFLINEIFLGSARGISYSVLNFSGIIDFDATMLKVMAIFVLLQLIELVAVSFAVSRFALIPVMVRNQDLSFREAWRRQIDVFDQYKGSTRARFFWIFLALLVVTTTFHWMVASLPYDGAALGMLVSLVSFILLVAVPIAVLTHTVRSHPVPEAVGGDGPQTDTKTLGGETDDDTGK